MIVRDSLVHEVDVTRFLFDEEITSIQIVKPSANPAAPEGLQDPQIAILRTASGKHVDVEVFVTTGVAYEVRTEVVGERGSAMIGLDVGLVRKSAPGHWGGADHARLPRAFRAGLRHRDPALGGRVQGRRRHRRLHRRPGRWDGYAAAAVCEAGVQSLETGRPSRSRWSTARSIEGA